MQILFSAINLTPAFNKCKKNIKSKKTKSII